MSWMRWVGLCIIKSTIGNRPCRMSLCIPGVLVHLLRSQKTFPGPVDVSQCEQQQCVSSKATHGIDLECCNQVGL